MPPQRRRLLVHTAAQEFASAGYERASLNRIIRDCGLSKSSFYHVIASKKELFNLVIRDLGAAIRASVDIPGPEDFATADFWEVARRLLDRLGRASQADESFAALGRMFYLSGTPDDGDNGVDEALVAVENWLGEVLQAGRNTGSVRDDLPLSLQSRLVFTVLHTLDEWTVTHLDSLTTEEIPLLAHAQLGAVRRILEPEVTPGT